MTQTMVDIRSRAQAALAASPIYLLRQIEVDVLDGATLLLRGRVDTYYHKQLAQEVVRAVCDGTRVVNRIDVEEYAVSGWSLFD